ncbi:MAG: Tex family protein [Anaeroplasma sp.]|uniref:Tex family protein n=1 Tax=Anaeroplasma sp. TaxID=1872523 RepID=UPI002A91A4DA|nr:Tex family protein [Anaeroplasma sp.]MDY5982799.1 Tex family protein [Anaeroplasma sp.]
MADVVLNDNVLKTIEDKFKVKRDQIGAVLEMLADDKTVAFIARYRKEATGGLDEEAIRAISDEYNYGVALEKRKADVIRLIEEKGMMTDSLREDILNASKLIDVEDLYRPYKEKKKTKATEAIALGLEPLADIMLKLYNQGDKCEIVSKFLTDKVKTIDDAITNAKYIVAEKISDNADFRKYIRDAALKYGTIICKKKKNDKDPEEKYKNYYDSSEKTGWIKPHRVLAINRAEDEDVINVTLELQPERDIDFLRRHITRNRDSLFKQELEEAIEDSYKRLIAPSIGREIRSILSENAEEQAIHIFAMNVKNLLLQAPMKGQVVLGVDPAYRTGCKLAVIDENSGVKEIGVIYPNEKSKDSKVDPKLVMESKITIARLIKKYNVSIIAIGNGTAGRETESFIADVIKENGFDCKYVMVSEAGASVYSASDIAIEEFPDLTVEKRSAISIARRIQDPLAELVKIDPKSIGVGQYQHDVTQSKLNKALDDVVSDAVNKVGVNLNTASISLLSYVSGLTKTVSKNIIAYRDENGGFKSREELKKVAKLGPKTYEQCVGFLRILNAIDPLDQTPIHPESYDKAKAILKLMNLSANDLGTEKIREEIKKLDKSQISKDLSIDMFTLNDILDAFEKPLRDIRDSYPGLKLRSDIMHFEDIKVGDELDGTVRNVVDFGAFIDCGVKYDGLVHVSKMSTQKVAHPSDILSVGDQVHVYVIDIDYQKHKMALSLIKQQ